MLQEVAAAAAVRSQHLTAKIPLYLNLVQFKLNGF